VRALADTGRRLLAAGSGLVAGALTVLVVVVLVVPWLTGGRSFTVMSGSMHPTIATGDVVVDRGIRAHEARVGEIVTFPDPGGGDRLLTHRIRSIAPGPRGTLAFTTQGDANNTPERWTMARNGHLGHVLVRIPAAGRALALTRTRAGHLVLFSLPLILFLVWLLHVIWRPAKPREAL
jgi:signal peptidase I